MNSLWILFIAAQIFSTGHIIINDRANGMALRVRFYGRFKNLIKK